MRTVKVRVVVAVDGAEHWCAQGDEATSVEASISSVRDFVDPGERIYILTAELEVPESHPVVEIAANVEEHAP